MCIAVVILLTSFPATAENLLFCYDNIDNCNPDNDRECCKLWTGNLSYKTRYCACFAMTYRNQEKFLRVLLSRCKLPSGVERFKCHETTITAKFIDIKNGY